MYDAIRKLILPLKDLERLVPKRGKILDVGCGHGTLARFLVKKNSKRFVTGIDPSFQKIKIARKLARNFKNLSFENKYINEIKGIFDCIIISDVLYLFPDQQKINLLRKCKSILKKNGFLIVKTDSHEPKWLFKIIRLQEFIMIRILKFTHSDYGGFYSLDKYGYKEVIEKAGFNVSETKTFKSIIPYRHPTFIALKQ